MPRIGPENMEIEMLRQHKSKKSTISTLYVDGYPVCFTLEDVDRGLKDSMSILEIKARKIFGRTAIPSGRYRIVISFSPRFKKYLPELLNVKGYAGIRIHKGNIAEHTEGCLLTGSSYDTDIVYDSGKAFDSLFQAMKAVEKIEEIWITIK